MLFRKKGTNSNRIENTFSQEPYGNYGGGYEQGQNNMIRNPLAEVDREGETTLLSEDYDAREGETTLLEENPEEPDKKEEVFVEDAPEEEYAGQTSLLSEEFSPYLHPEQYDNQPRNTEASENIEEESGQGDAGETTLLSPDNTYVPQGIWIPQNAPKAYLIDIVKSQKTQIDKIKYTIGSSQESDYIIQNSAVSRKHAFIIYKDGAYYLMDNRSTNNTLLDGIVLEPLKSTKLYYGALIQFSDELFQFVCD